MKFSRPARLRSLLTSYTLLPSVSVYGFLTVLNEWYEKDPNKVTEAEFSQLVREFNKSLGQFDGIWFYHNPGKFHKLYKKLLKKTELKNKIKLFTHLNQITKQVKVGRHQDLSETCKWLHEQSESLPVFRYPFDLKLLPKNGVYFFMKKVRFRTWRRCRQTKNCKDRNSQRKQFQIKNF
jgi:hypothetical protein